MPGHQETQLHLITLKVQGLESWWHNQMETFSALLALCEGNPLVTTGFPLQRPVTQSFECFLWSLPEQMAEQTTKRWWFEMPLYSLWRHCNDSRNTMAPDDLAPSIIRSSASMVNGIAYVRYVNPWYLWERISTPFAVYVQRYVMKCMYVFLIFQNNSAYKGLILIMQVLYTVQWHYNAVNLLTNPHNRYPIARCEGEIWGVICEFNHNVLQSMPCCMIYQVILYRVIMALVCIQMQLVFV